MNAHTLSSRLTVFVATVLLFSPFAAAQTTTWQGSSGNGGDGAWATPGDWLGGIPTSGTSAVFYTDGTFSATSTVTVAGANSARSLFVGSGKTVELKMASGSSLSASGAITLIGLDSGTGTTAANLTYSGPASGSATLNLGSFYVGREKSNDNTLVFSGSLTISDPGTGVSYVGVGNGPGGPSVNNLLKVLDGANLTRFGLVVGRGTTSISGNGILLDGAGSKLTVNGGGAARGFVIGSFSGGQGNYLSVQGGAVVNVDTGVGGSSQNFLNVGNSSGSRDNYITVDGAGSLLDLKSSSSLTLGHASGYGGNYVEVGGTGSITTNGTMIINTFAVNGGNNSGNNRLTIKNGGTLTSSSTVSNSGLLQLKAGGIYTGTSTLTVTSTGRFEAEGTGLGSQVATTINNLGTLALGTTSGRFTGSLLTLNSTVTLATGAVFEATIFGVGDSDQIVLGATGDLDLSAGGAVFKLLLSGYAPVAGNQWTIFTGATGAGINGVFPEGSAILPALGGGLSWDYSNFNEAGNWNIAVVPEPGVLPLVFIGLCLVAGLSKRRRVGMSQERAV